MKRILFLVAMVAAMNTGAQVFNGKAEPQNTQNATSFYGKTPINYVTGNICAVVLNTVTPVASGKLDTLGLLNPGTADTGYLQFTLNNKFDLLFDFYVTKISGTVAATSLLQGSLDNATWFTLTGNTTYCATCQGASATITNTAGTKHYQWFLPGNATNYPYYQVQTITTGTMTATYGGTGSYKY